MNCIYVFLTGPCKVEHLMPINNGMTIYEFPVVLLIKKTL